MDRPTYGWPALPLIGIMQEEARNVARSIIRALVRDLVRRMPSRRPSLGRCGGKAQFRRFRKRQKRAIQRCLEAAHA